VGAFNALRPILLTVFEGMRVYGALTLWGLYLYGLYLTGDPFIRYRPLVGHLYSISLLFTTACVSHKNPVLAISLVPGLAGLHELIFNAAYAAVRLNQPGYWLSLYINWAQVASLLLPLIVLPQLRYAWRYLLSIEAAPLYAYLFIWALAGLPVSIDQLTGASQRGPDLLELVYTSIFAGTWLAFRLRRRG
jgi:hypothetical protein